MTVAHPLLVSVIVPVFNEPRRVLEESLGSLRSQTFAAFECIVIDDSTDPNTRAACEALCGEDPRFRYLHPPTRLGLAGALNLALSLARGELIARFDADDICLPDRLARQTAFLADHPEVDVLGSALEMVDAAGAPWAVRPYPIRHSDIARRMQFTNALAHPTVVIRRRALDRWGAYDPSYRFAEDLDLWLRLLNAGAVFANIEAPLVRYRQVATGRGAGNWRHNLRARVSNFSHHQLPWRLAGLAAIAIWAALPQAARSAIYGLLMFARPARLRKVT